MYYDRVKYQLLYKEDILDISEPVNWNDAEFKWERNMNYHGVFVSVSEKLIFVEEASEFITYVKKKYGVNESIVLIKKSKNEITEEWYNDLTFVLDLITYEYDNNNKSVSVNTVSGGVIELIKSKQNEKIEIDKTENILGQTLPELYTNVLELNGRRIYLISKDNKKEQEQFEEINKRYRIQREDRSPKTKVSLLNNLLYRSDDLFNNISEESNNIIYDINNPDLQIFSWWENPTTNMMFYMDSNKDKTIKVNININQRLIYPQTFFTNGIKIRLVLNKYSNGSDYNNETTVQQLFYGVIPANGHLDILFNDSINVFLNKKDSLSIMYELYYENNTSVIWGDIKLKSETTILDITVEEDSTYDATETTCILAHELFERSLNLIGINNFISNYFGRTNLGYNVDGLGALTAFAHGHWIRQFNNSNLFKHFQTSFKEVYESVNVVHPIGMYINKKGGKEYVCIENREYFYQKFISIKLDNVFNIKRTTAQDFHYSSIEIGYDKPSGDNLYDEAQGLDEPNVLTSYSTIITKTENKTEIKSSYRADSYGIEFARRKQFINYPTTDTSYDKTIFIVDVEYSENLGKYRVSLWQDDLDSEPTGIFSPETAFNLMFSPARLLLKHAQWLKAGLTRYNNSLFRYISSDGNSGLITVKDGVEISERQDIELIKTKFARHGAEYVEFDAELTQDIKDKLNGKTNEIPNVYGLIEFINEFGKKEKGYLLSVTNNKFKILCNG